MATKTLKAAGAGAWDTAADWDPAGKPAATDDVIIAKTGWTGPAGPETVKTLDARGMACSDDATTINITVTGAILWDTGSWLGVAGDNCIFTGGDHSGTVGNDCIFDATTIGSYVGAIVGLRTILRNGSYTLACQGPAASTPLANAMRVRSGAYLDDQNGSNQGPVVIEADAGDNGNGQQQIAGDAPMTVWTEKNVSINRSTNDGEPFYITPLRTGLYITVVPAVFGGQLISDGLTIPTPAQVVTTAAVSTSAANSATGTVDIAADNPTGRQGRRLRRS